MGVTIKDVARRTGLSVTTVSLVLNKKESRISERTRQLVETAAQELNYTPNQTAVSLATKRTRVIGLLLPETGYYYYADLIHSVESACRNAGYFLTLSIAGLDEEQMVEQMVSLVHHQIDGLILDPSSLEEDADSCLEVLEQLKLPVVLLGCVNARLLPNSIVPAHRQGGYLAASHLLELGHRQVGCACGPLSCTAAADFLRGYREALEEYGLAFREELVQEGAYSLELGAAALGELRRQGVTAIAAGSDLIAWGICRAARRMGLSIPEDLSVTGYGDTAVSAGMEVPLTSVSVHFDRIARKAVNLIRHREGLSPETITPTLICRESTQKPKEAVL